MLAHIIKQQMLGLALMNLMVNVMQGPARTLVNDVVPEEKLQLGNAMVSTVMGMSWTSLLFWPYLVVLFERA